MQGKKTKNTKKLIVSTLAISALLTGSAFAAESTSASSKVNTFMRHMRGLGTTETAPAAFGKITAINGSSITISGKSNTTYTVDVSSAKFYRGKDTAITLSDLAVNDMVVVEGTVNGTTITATVLRIGGPRGIPGGMPTMMGERGVMGTVSTVSGTTFTVATPAFVPHMRGASSTPTIVATTPTLVNVVTGSNTVFMKDGATSTIASVVSGSRVLVEGSKDAAGTTITATKVLVMTKDLERGPRGMGHMMGRGKQTTTSN
jgi:hypothetical protein